MCLPRKYKDASLLSDEESEECGGEGGMLGSGLVALGPLNTTPYPHHQQLTQADSLEKAPDSGPSQIRRYIM